MLRSDFETFRHLGVALCDLKGKELIEHATLSQLGVREGVTLLRCSMSQKEEEKERRERGKETRKEKGEREALLIVPCRYCIGITWLVAGEGTPWGCPEANGERAKQRREDTHLAS